MRALRDLHAQSRGAFLRWHAVTADDVVFSWSCCAITGGRTTAPITPRSKKSKFSARAPFASIFPTADDRELPLILGLMPVLPRHAIDPAKFENTSFGETGRQRTLRRRATSKPGESVTFKRDPNYSGRDLPINRGLWNFDEMRFDFYRDENAYFEAFKAGLYDVRSETRSSALGDRLRFSRGARRARRSRKHLPTALPKLIQLLRLQHPPLDLRRYPRAPGDLRCLFDFEWINRDFFFNLYRRSASFFDDSELSRLSTARPMNASGRCSRHFRMPCVPTCSTAPGRRRSATAPAATAICSAKRSRSLPPPL